MAGGAAECDNGHRFCIQCAVTSTAKDFGIHHLKWSSSIHQALTWSRFTCCVCGARGPLRRSSVVDAAVGALPVRCGSTALGLACRWSGRRDQFDTHQHVFTDPVQDQPGTQDHSCRPGKKRLSSIFTDSTQDQPGTQDHPSRRRKKPLSSASNTDSDETDGPRVKRRRYQDTADGNENEGASQRVQTIDSDVVPVSAFPDINASGESVEGVVLDMAVPHIARTGVIIHTAVAAAADDDDDDDSRREDELHISQEEMLTVQTAVNNVVRDRVVPGGGGADITHDADREEDESFITADIELQPSQNPTAGDVREPVLADLRGSEVFHDVDGQARELDIIPGQFNAVHSALQSAGFVPKPTIPPVDRAAKFIYNVTARVVHRVIKTFKPSAP